MSKRKYCTIPNLLTFSSLLLAMAGMLLVSNGDIFLAIIPLALCDIFDAMDGYIARKFNMSSPIGIELDSLVDAVAFVVPPFVISLFLGGHLLIATSFFYVCCGVFRLARFNCEATPGLFIGLPVSISANCIYLALLLRIPEAHLLPILYCVAAIFMVSNFSLRKRHSLYLTVVLVTFNVSLSIYNSL